MGDGRTADLLVLGDCNPDVLVLGGDVTPEFGQQEKLVDQMVLTVGGSASITAVAAARLGLRVALVAAVGDDPAGRFMLGQLEAEGVDVSAVAVRAGAPTGMTVALSRGEDRAILTATGAMASLTADDVPQELLRAARHVHVSSYFLFEPALGPGLAALFAAARGAGASTSLDTNWDPAGRWGGAMLRGVLAETSLLLPNEAEALQLARRDSLAGAASALTAGGATLVVKQGDRGALCATPGEPGAVHVQLPPVRPVDTTGAGDCFNAGLITGLLRGLPLPRAAALGCAVAAASTQAPGGTGSPVHLDAALSRAQAVSIEQAALGTGSA